MGGEKMKTKEGQKKKAGSPPRGRGKAAGLLTFWSLKKDHPRVGGEKRIPEKSVAENLGSPPLGRGKVYLGPQLGAGDGITPAWAGKSPIISHFRGVFKDHPRVGGEKHIANFDDENGQGSPPRGRGKESEYLLIATELRITPAWAGKSGTC